MSRVVEIRMRLEFFFFLMAIKSVRMSSSNLGVSMIRSNETSSHSSGVKNQVLGWGFGCAETFFRAEIGDEE